MSTGGVAAVVDVVDQTRTDTETSTIGDTIGTERIQNNPVNGRDFTRLLATVPGSVQTTNQFQTSINGIPSTFGGASVLVDGIDAGRVDLNGTSNVLGRIESRVNRVSMDSIQEVQVLEQSYSAQYGEALKCRHQPDHEIRNEPVSRKCLSTTSETNISMQTISLITHPDFRVRTSD